MSAKKVDANQPEIVAALRKAGAVVQDLHEIGKGCADVLVGFRGRLYMLEIKAPKGKLTPDEQEWHRIWSRYPLYVVRDIEDALRVIGAETWSNEWPS